MKQHLNYSKVKTLWEGHKIWKKSPSCFDVYLLSKSANLSKQEIFFQICVAFSEKLNFKGFEIVYGLGKSRPDHGLASLTYYIQCPCWCNSFENQNLRKTRSKLSWLMTLIRVCLLCPPVYLFSPPTWAAQLWELVLLPVSMSSPINNPA